MWRIVRILALLVVLICQFSPRSADATDKPSFRIDLKQFGYIKDHETAEYSSLGFLSDELLLVTINQRVFRGNDPFITDKPPSTLVVFDLGKGHAIRSAAMRINKSPRSVAPLTSGNFLLLSASEVKLCSADLRCEKSFPGGEFMTALDSDSLKLLKGADTFVLRSDDTSTNGARTLSSELSSTIRNRIMHPLDIDEPSPPDFLRITVYDNRSAKTLLSLHYNPKNQLVGPAISPNGAKLAIVREGRLEVYDLP